MAATSQRVALRDAAQPLSPASTETPNMPPYADLRPLRTGGASPSATLTLTRRKLWWSVGEVLHRGEGSAASVSQQACQRKPALPDHAQATLGPTTSYGTSVFNPWSWDGWVVLHLGTASVLLCFSAILMLPAETFKSSPDYSFFQSVAPEWAWSLLLGTGACTGFWGVGTNRPLARYLSCTLLSLLHTLLALCFLFSNPISTGSTTYSILALLALLRLVAGR